MPPKALVVRGERQPAAEFERAETHARGIAVIEGAIGVAARSRSRVERRRWCAAQRAKRADEQNDEQARRPTACRRASQRRRVPRQATRRGARAWCGAGRSAAGILLEQFGELLGHGAAEFLGIDDGDGAAVIARDVMADADGDQFDRRAGLDLLDHPAQMPLEIIAGIDRQRGIVDRRAVGDHHQDLALLGARQQALVRPVERLAVDVLLKQALAHHQPEIFARAPPRRVGRFVDDVAQVVEAAGIGRLAGGAAKPRATARPSRRAW